MGERQPRVGASERRIELDGAAEKALGVGVVRPVELVHVPETAVVRLPGVERARRFEERALTLRGFDFLGDRRDDSGVTRLRKLDDDREATIVASYGAARDVIHVQDAPRLLRADAVLTQRV